MDLIEIAKQILEVNTGASLSGSLALNIQGKKTRRPPQDIDIFIPYGEKIQTIEGMKPVDQEGDYEDEEYERFSYKLGKVCIDVFRPIDEDITVSRAYENGLSMLSYTEIIHFKLKHAFGGSYTKYKHKDDIIALLVNNIF